MPATRAQQGRQRPLIYFDWEYENLFQQAALFNWFKVQCLKFKVSVSAGVLNNQFISRSSGSQEL
jgi:hypothetical protein